MSFAASPSLSDDHKALTDAAKLLEGWLHDLGFDTSIHSLGGAVNPPLVFGKREHPRARRTLLIYGHYDVQPADPEGWNTPPFEPVIRDDILYCRGANDPKGQLICQFAALRAIGQLGADLPLNLRFVLDPQEEIGSPLLGDFVRANRDRFEADLCFMADGDRLLATACRFSLEIAACFT